MKRTWNKTGRMTRMTGTDGKTSIRKKATTAANQLEADEQKLLFEWAEYAEVLYPELQLMFHIVNEGRRSYRSGHELRKQGMKAGVPDVCLPVSRGQYGALYIEMKRTKGGRVSDAQQWWIDELNKAGNLAVVCHGFDEAKDIVLKYLQKTK